MAEKTEADTVPRADLEKLQGHVNTVQQRQKQKYEARISELEGELEQYRQFKTAAEARLRDFEAQAAQLAAERDAAQGETQAILSQQRDERCRAQLASVFEQAGGLPSTFKTAALLIGQQHEVEFNDQGELVAIDGQADVGEAMKGFLDEHSYLAKAPPSGPSPTGRPNGRPFTQHTDITNMNPADLIQSGLEEK